jgi:hypothetical protein
MIGFLLVRLPAKTGQIPWAASSAAVAFVRLGFARACHLSLLLIDLALVRGCQASERKYLHAWAVLDLQLPAREQVRAPARALVTVRLSPMTPIQARARSDDIRAGPSAAVVVALAIERSCAILDLVPKSCPVAVD